MPGRVADAVMPGFKPTAPPIEQQFQDLTRYLDQMVFRIEEASRVFEIEAGTPEAEVEAARLRLEAIRWATRLTSGPNSLTNALDLVVLASTFRWLQEDYWIPEVWGEAARALVVALRQVEKDGWTLLEAYLDEPRVAEARRVLALWREKNPLIQRESFAEFPTFRTLAEGQPAELEGETTSLLGLLGLDPVSGLEPAAREVERARQLGLRALFFLQRAPRLVAAELEYRVLRVRASVEARQALANTERIATSLESFAATTAALPEAVRLEREALVRDLEQAQEPLGRLLEKTQATLVAGERTSAEVNRAIRTLDAFAARFDQREGPAAQPDALARPFDVTEYGQAAERIGVGANQLTALVAELDRSLPEIQGILDQAVAVGERSVDRAARRLLEVGLILIAASALAVWIGLRLGARAGSRRRHEKPLRPVSP